MKLFINVCIAIGLLSSGCVEVSDKNKNGTSAAVGGEQEPAQEPAHKPVDEEGSKGQIIPRNEKASFKIVNSEVPNSYKINFAVPIDANAIIKSGGDLSSKQKIYIGTEVVEYTDSEVKPGLKYVYEFGKLDLVSAEFVQRDRLEVKVPKDLLISSDIGLKERTDWTQYQRVYLMNRSVITTNGNDLNINATELISENAKVQTFSHNQKASIDNDGRSGGQITLVVEKATGNITFEMRGENGGDGKQERGYIKGPPVEISVDQIYLIAKNGKNGGNTGALFATFKDTSDLSIYYSRTVGVGGLPSQSSPPALPAVNGQDGKFERICLNGPRLLNQCQ